MTAPTDRELDALLREWAGRSRLTDARAETIRAAIVAETPGPRVDAAWWHELVTDVTRAVVQAATMPEAARAALASTSPIISPLPFPA